MTVQGVWGPWRTEFYLQMQHVQEAHDEYENTRQLRGQECYQHLEEAAEDLKEILSGLDVGLSQLKAALGLQAMPMKPTAKQGKAEIAFEPTEEEQQAQKWVLVTLSCTINSQSRQLLGLVLGFFKLKVVYCTQFPPMAVEKHTLVWRHQNSRELRFKIQLTWSTFVIAKVQKLAQCNMLRTWIWLHHLCFHWMWEHVGLLLKNGLCCLSNDPPCRGILADFESHSLGILRA